MQFKIRLKDAMSRTLQLVLNIFFELKILKGTKVNIVKLKKEIINLPALISRPVDNLGAGDAAFSYASLFVNYSNNKLVEK